MLSYGFELKPTRIKLKPTTYRNESFLIWNVVSASESYFNCYQQFSEIGPPRGEMDHIAAEEAVWYQKRRKTIEWVHALKVCVLEYCC